MMRFDILTLFPRMFDSYIGESILKRAQEAGHISIATHNIRDFTADKHHKTDDTPYGGGAGMVMKAEPIWKAVESLRMQPAASRRVILLSAKGKAFRQEDVRRLSAYEQLIFICGRYEGVDERVAEHIADEELSIGDFVLTGGELPALTVIDAVARLVPGVLGNETSADTESHREPGYLEHPQYTKPEVFNGWKVPEVLLSGNHADIDRWRQEHSSERR
ncbi:MAG: tRNA (guanosine(37)-N1)-methyltransferase TrmD [Candidatus Moraniibacteriota bacterium]|nr:MAG: tRNA (guanosine(37)-N1)-methyltransferase TrmD [Candidatus Moranbacteria bacterium]